MLSHSKKIVVVKPPSTDGVYIDGHLSSDMTGPMAANIVLRDPTVDVAVMETARGGIPAGWIGL
jgi:cyanophycin synthetase